MLSLIQYRVEMLPLIRNTQTTISDSVQRRKAAPDQKYLECYLGHTSWTLDVEAEDSESQVEFVFHIFLAGVELLPLVYVLPTVVAPTTCISTHYIRYRYKYQDRLYQTTGTHILAIDSNQDARLSRPEGLVISVCHQFQNTISSLFSILDKNIKKYWCND